MTYQACNFYYTGMSDKHIYWCVKGKEHLHERAILDEFKGMKKSKKSNLFNGEFIIDVIKDKPIDTKDFLLFGYKKCDSIEEMNSN